MMKKRLSLVLAGLACAAWVSLAAAKRNDPDISLEFVPQQTVGAVSVNIGPALLKTPVELRVTDGRRVDEPLWIGTRTDDDDRVQPLKATTDVAQYVAKVVEQLAAQWGLQLETGADLVLDVTLRTFQLVETNQAVGATFRGEARLGLALVDRSGRTLWDGASSASASRYGRKFSNANSNEVLSDALLGSWAAALSREGLHEAWAGRLPSPESPESPAPAADGPTSPRRLLEEIEALIAQDFTAETLLEFVRGKTLDRALEADDLTAWKQAGVPEEVIRAALNLPVR